MLKLTTQLLTFLAPSLMLVASSHSVEWSAWSTCSKTCDEGIRMRNRTCESCNTTLQTQSCNGIPCKDMQTQIAVVVLVSIAVISILTAVLVVIFFVKGTNSSKPRASSMDTSKRLQTMSNERTHNLEHRVFQLQRMADSRGSLQSSRTTLKDFIEPQLRVSAQM